MVVAGLTVDVVHAQAQSPLAPVAPLAPKSVQPLPPRGATVVTLAAAQRAQDLGLPSIAADLYRQLRDQPGSERAAMNLGLATALLDADQAAEAEQVLAEIPAPHGAEWRLRAGLAALHLGQRDAAQQQWDAIVEAEVPPADLPWYRFFTAALYDTATPRDVTRANQFYLQAEALAATELSRARFQLAGEQVRLHLLNKPSETDLRQVRENVERFAGRALGYDAAKNYAVMLAEGGQTAEAVAMLQRVLVGVPVQERAARDELRFVLGLIGDRGRGGAGRNALLQLLENGRNLQRQRQALQLLADASRAGPARRQFREDLDKLIAAKPPHPALENLYFYRAQLALADKDFVRAEEDASALLNQFPLSPLRVHALGMLTQSAWEQGRYRVVATNARQARAELATRSAADGSANAAHRVPVETARARVDLGVLEAEASFRAGDYRSAADAYAAVLSERAELDPSRVGELMFQRVLAEIKTGSGQAGKVIDELERDPAFDLENRWQSEWSLARALQLQGESGVKEAYTRVDNLLREPAAATAALKPELRAKVAWLRVKLSFENGAPARTIELADELLKESLNVDAELKAEIASIVMLLKARAEFAVGREPVALETLKRLREGFRETDAAISSYLIEAEHYAAQDKIDEASKVLVELTDNAAYKSSPYVPYALYRLALLSERLGREENLKEANRRIEQLIEISGKDSTDHDLIFAARLKQGDLLRKLNQFPQAQQAYEDLVNKYSRRPDVVLAQLALAECRNAQSSVDPGDRSHAAAAQLIFGQLRDRVDAPRDVRVEAGYNLGLLLAREGKSEEAAKVWWNDVVAPFLIEETKPMEPLAKRPYWLARTLCELGDLQEKRGRFEEAKAAYVLLLERRLPYGEAIARARLQQLGVPQPKAGQ